MMIEELIQDLEHIREVYGPHIEVTKRRVNISDGSIQHVFIKTVRVDNTHSNITVVSL